MKKHHSPRGKRPALRRLAFGFSAVAILSTCAVIIDRDGTLTSDSAATSTIHWWAPPRPVSALAQVGLGAFHSDKKRAAVSLPRGMTIPENDQRMFLVALPNGVTKEGEATSLAGKGTKVLGQASQEAVAAATKVKLSAK